MEKLWYITYDSLSHRCGGEDVREHVTMGTNLIHKKKYLPPVSSTPAWLNRRLDRRVTKFAHIAESFTITPASSRFWRTNEMSSRARPKTSLVHDHRYCYFRHVRKLMKELAPRQSQYVTSGCRFKCLKSGAVGGTGANSELWSCTRIFIICSFSRKLRAICMERKGT